ncbi:MAG: MMPL family transporter, partial [Georgfuchsia sp.]
MRFSPHAARTIQPVALWVLAMTFCLLVVLRTEFTADMSAFLPKNPTAEQQLLVDQLKEGVLSRTLLIGIEGADAVTRAALSLGLAQRMQADGDFAVVRNGAVDAMEKDRQFLFNHRYLLSPAVTAERFSVDGLHNAIGNSIDLLGSPAGMLLKKLLPHDPTGEMIELLGTFDSDSSPASQFGVWASRDGQRAILMAQTLGAGSDTDAQQRAIAGIRTAFAAEAETRGIRDASVLISGAPVFAVDARSTIQAEVIRLSIISAVGIITLLLLAYRSVAALLFGLLPVVSGALAGIAAVSLGFGSVHGITIGFGTTLIGEAVDYTIYYFVQSRDDAGGDVASDASWIERFWPTIRLGVLTSVCGFASLLFSGFPGLAQLGLYSIAGLVTAAIVTRFVLPHLRPAGLRIRHFGNGGIGRLAAAGIARLGKLRLGRWALALLALLAALVIANKQDKLWSDSLSSLSPVSATLRDQDMALRSDLGAPDLRYLVVVNGGDREAALASAERAGAVLNTLIEAKVIASYDSAAHFLPSRATQQQRRDALPEREKLARRLSAATRDLPLRADKLTPFLDDVAAARSQHLLDREQLE